MVYDPASDMVWTIDGQGMTYFLSLLTHQWSPLATIGPAPPIRGRAGITIDAVRHHLVVNSGATPPGDDTHDDAWALPLDGPSVWTVLDSAATRAPIRGGAGDGYDAARHRLLVFGGSDELGSFRNDTWALDLGPVPRWTPVATQGALPPARYWHATAWDDTHDRLVAFGGYDGNATQPLADLWTLSFGSGTPTWTPITPPGPAPAGRIRSQLVYDSSRDRFLLIAGYNGAVSLADVWELRLSPTPAWRLLTPGGAPPAARSGEMCVYEPAHDRVLMFGGSTSNTYFDDLWALNLGSDDGAWQQLPAPGGPSRRTSGLLRLDPGRGRLYLFGGDGFESPNSITHLNDTWALDLLGIPTWHALAPAGLPPEGRDRANGAYDPIHDRLVVTCGNFGLNDVHTLDFGDAPTPTLISLAIRDVTPDRVRLVWGGAEPGTRVIAYRREPPSEWRSLATLTADGEGYVTLEDRDVTPGALLEYRLGVITGQGEEFFGATRVEVPRRALALAARATDGRAAFTVELPRGEPATLALFDIAGRGVWTRAVGDLGAGVHEVRADDVRLPPTLYFARLTQGRETCVVRFVIVH
jgi:hypothetical protein